MVACEELLIKSLLTFIVPKNMQPFLVLPTSCTANAVNLKGRPKKKKVFNKTLKCFVVLLFLPVFIVLTAATVFCFLSHTHGGRQEGKQILCAVASKFVVAKYCLQFSVKILFAFAKQVKYGTYDF